MHARARALLSHNVRTQCAKGNDAACDALVNDPGAVAALQHIDAKNPQGFTAKHPHKAATLEKKFDIGHPPHMFREPPRAARRRRAHVQRVEVQRPRGLPRQAARRVPEPAHRVPEPLSYYKKNREARKAREDAFDREFGRMHAATRVPEPLSYYGKGFTGVEKSYKTAHSTAAEWHSAAWKDGALGGGNTQWLKACAEGNYYACNKLEKNNDDIHDVLKPKHKVRPAVRKTARVPTAVFVAQKPSVWGQMMAAIGLGDSYYKNAEPLRQVPKMDPDSGMHHPSYCLSRVIVIQPVRGHACTRPRLHSATPARGRACTVQRGPGSCRCPMLSLLPCRCLIVCFEQVWSEGTQTNTMMARWPSSSQMNQASNEQGPCDRARKLPKQLPCSPAVVVVKQY